MGGMEGMLVGLPPAVGVLARIPERKGVQKVQGAIGPAALGTRFGPGTARPPGLDQRQSSSIAVCVFRME